MIIRFTVYDNDYTDAIKSFYKHIKFDNAMWLKTNAFALIDDFDELLKKFIYNKTEITNKDVEQMNYLLECKFNYFLKQIGEEHLIHEKSIEIVPMVADVNHNGEYIYYFVETEQIIIL